MSISKPPIPEAVLAWLLEDDYWGRLQTNIEKRGKPSKWITLTALRVMKRMGTRV